MYSNKLSHKIIYRVSSVLFGLLSIIVLILRVYFLIDYRIVIILFGFLLLITVILWFLDSILTQFWNGLINVENYINIFENAGYLNKQVFIHNRFRRRNTIYCSDSMRDIAEVEQEIDKTFSDGIGEFLPLLIEKKWLRKLIGKPSIVTEKDTDSIIWEYSCRNGYFLIRMNGILEEHYSEFLLFFFIDNAITRFISKDGL